MQSLVRIILLPIALASMMAHGQGVTVLRDLDANGRVTLTAEELKQLLPNAKMSRTVARGDTHRWKNESSGTFIVSSDNKANGGHPASTSGKWHIAEDGRYCVLIEWKSVDTEEWCRYIVKSGSDYYATKSDKTGTEKVYKLSISK